MREARASETQTSSGSSDTEVNEFSVMPARASPVPGSHDRDARGEGADAAMELAGYVCCSEAHVAPLAGPGTIDDLPLGLAGKTL